MAINEQEEFFGPDEKPLVNPRLAIILVGIFLLVCGFGFWKLSYKNVVKADASSVIVNVPTAENVSDWQNYTSSKFKFSFSYPTGWEKEEQINNASLLNLAFSEKSAPVFRVKIFENLSKMDSKNLNLLSVKDYLDKYSTDSSFVYKDISETKIDKLDAYKASLGAVGSSGDTVYLVRLPNNQIVTFRFFAGVSETEIQGIIKSIKFDSTNMSLVKTYSNSDLKFSFDYPKVWKEIEINQLPNDDKVKNLGTAYSSLYNKDVAGPVYFDTDSFFSFKVYSNDYNGFPFAVVGVQKVDANWTKEQFVENMKLPNEILGYKKIGNNGVLVLDYASYSCNQSFTVNIFVPTTNPSYPDLIINLNLGNLALSQTVQDYVAIATKNKKDTCNPQEAYQLIADKIIANTYSDDMTIKLKTAEAIVNSFKNL